MSDMRAGHRLQPKEPTIEERAAMNHNAKLVLDAERQEASAAAAAAAAEKAARPKVSAGDMFAEMAAEEKRMCKQYAEKRHGATVIADFNRPASSGAGDKKKKKKKKSTKKAVAYKLPQTTVRRTDDADAGAGGAGASSAASAVGGGADDTATAAPSPPAPPFESARALLIEHQRDLNCATDPDVRVRKRAMEKLHLSLFGPPAPLVAITTGDLELPEHSTPLPDSAYSSTLPGVPTGLHKAAAAHAAVPGISGNGATQARQKPEVLREAFEEAGKPLLKLFADPSERVRELAVRIYTGFIAASQNLAPVLPYFFPVLMSRISPEVGYDVENEVFYKDHKENIAKNMGRVSAEQDRHDRAIVVEPAEEVRLLNCRLLGTLLRVICEQRATPLLSNYFHEAMIFMQVSANDPFPELKVEACAWLTYLSRACVEGVKLYAIALARALRWNLDHRHARVRLALLEATHEVIKCPKAEKCKGAGTEAIVDLIGHRDSNVLPVAAFYRADTTVNYFAKLVVDHSPAVRARFYEMLADWACHLLDRADHWSRLTPYLLSGFHDESAEVRRICCDAIAELGREYEREHYDDVQDRRQYGVEGARHLNLDRPLPAPFDANGGRPRLGARLFVRGQVRRFTGPLLGELTNWVSKTRKSAALLLKTVLVFQEETSTQDCERIIAAMRQCVHAGDGVGEEIEAAAELLGGYLPLGETVLPLLLPHVLGGEMAQALVGKAGEAGGDVEAIVAGDGGTTSEKRAGALAVLGAVVRGAKPATILPHVRVLVSTVSNPGLLGGEQSDPMLRKALLAATSALCKALQGRGKAVVEAHFRETGRLASLGPTHCDLLRVLLVLSGDADLAGGAMKAVAMLAAAAQVDGPTPASIAAAKVAAAESAAAGKDVIEAECEAETARVSFFVGQHFGALLAGLTASFPQAALWSAECAEQRLLEQLLLLARTLPSWRLLLRAHVPALVAFFSSVAAGAHGDPRTCRAVRLHNAALLLGLLQGPGMAGDEGGDGDDLVAAWRAVGTDLLDSCLLHYSWGASPGLALARAELLAAVLLPRSTTTAKAATGTAPTAGGAEAAEGAHFLAPLFGVPQLRATAGKLAPILAVGLGVGLAPASPTASAASVAAAAASAAAVEASDLAATAGGETAAGVVGAVAEGRVRPPVTEHRLLSARLATALLSACAPPKGAPAPHSEALPSMFCDLHDALLPRLDDASDEVRCSVAEACAELAPLLPAAGGSGEELSESRAFEPLVRACMVQLRVGEPSDAFVLELMHALRCIAKAAPATFVLLCEEEVDVSRKRLAANAEDAAESLVASRFGELCDHGEVIAQFAAMKAGRSAE